MTPETIITILTFVSMLIYIALAIQGRKSQKRGLKAFFFKPNLSLFIVSASLMATQIGGGVLLGTADAAMQHGWVSLFYNAGTSLGLIFVGWSMAGFIRRTQAESAGALCEECYGSPLMRRLIGSLSILWMTGLLIAQLVALRKLLITIGIVDSRVFFGIWLCLVAYTSIGGFKAVVKADVIQVCLMISLFFLPFVVNYKSLINAASSPGQSGGVNLSFDYLGRLWLAPFLSAFLDQEMIQRFTSATTPKVARRSAFIAGAGVFIFAIIPAAFGISAAHEGFSVPSDNNALIAWLHYSHYPWGLILGSYAIIAAVISTCDSLLCAIGSLVTLDLTPRKNTKSSFYYMPSLVIAMVGFTAYYLSHFSDDILWVIVTSGGAFVSVAFVPIVYSYAGRRYPASAGFSAICTGLILYWTLSFFEMGVLSEVGAVSGSFLLFNLFNIKQLIYKYESSNL